MPNNETFTAEEIADRITIKTYGMGAELVETPFTDHLILQLANGQRFEIKVSEMS